LSVIVTRAEATNALGAVHFNQAAVNQSPGIIIRSCSADASAHALAVKNARGRSPIGCLNFIKTF